MIFLNRTLSEKDRFVKDSIRKRQRIVHSSMDFFLNYEKVCNFETYCFSHTLLVTIYNGTLSSAVCITRMWSELV